MSNQNNKAKNGKVRFNARQEALIVKTGVKAGRTAPLLKPFAPTKPDDLS